MLLSADNFRYSHTGLWLTAWKKRWQRRRLRRTTTRDGVCPSCAAPTTFAAVDPHHREQWVCLRCGSVPRQRALAKILEAAFPGRVRGHVHEIAPAVCGYLHLRRKFAACTFSYYWPGRSAAQVGAFRNMDMARQVVVDGCFDVVIAQDVLEHVLDPEACCREVSRTLAPGGSFYFTVPVQPGPTRRRVTVRDGVVTPVAPPAYHFDPISRAGALVTVDWGDDIDSIVGNAMNASFRRHTVIDDTMAISYPIDVFQVDRR